MNAELKWARRDVDEKVGEMWTIAENLIIEKDVEIENLRIKTMELTQSVYQNEMKIESLQLIIAELKEKLNAK